MSKLKKEILIQVDENAFIAMEKDGKMTYRIYNKEEKQYDIIEKEKLINLFNLNNEAELIDFFIKNDENIKIIEKDIESISVGFVEINKENKPAILYNKNGIKVPFFKEDMFLETAIYCGKEYYESTFGNLLNVLNADTLLDNVLYEYTAGYKEDKIILDFDKVYDNFSVIVQWRNYDIDAGTYSFRIYLTETLELEIDGEEVENEVSYVINSDILDKCIIQYKRVEYDKKNFINLYLELYSQFTAYKYIDVNRVINLNGNEIKIKTDNHNTSIILNSINNNNKEENIFKIGDKEIAVDIFELVFDKKYEYSFNELVDEDGDIISPDIEKKYLESINIDSSYQYTEEKLIRDISIYIAKNIYTTEKEDNHYCWRYKYMVEFWIDNKVTRIHPDKMMVRKYFVRKWY